MGETIEVDKEKLEELQRVAEYSYSKLQKTHDWDGPMCRMGHISLELEIILGNTDEEPRKFDYSDWCDWL